MSPRSEIAKALLNRIRAYHASPHDFDQFRLDKIGSGQGAQSYGHGLYFAENPKVSGQGGEYWKEFKERRLLDLADDRTRPWDYDTERTALEYLERSNFDRNAAAELARRNLAGSDPAQLERVVDLLRSDKQVGPRVYEVDINARPEQLLDWDVPLKGQPVEHSVLDAVRARADAPPEFGPDSKRIPWGTFYGDLSEGGRTGEQVYKMLRDPQVIGLPGDEASRFLRDEAGIPGLRYYDAASRQHAYNLDYARDLLKGWETAGQTDHNKYRAWADRLKQMERQPVTSNYVIWDPSIVEITKKLAVPGVAGAGAMSDLARQDQYD